MAEFQFKEFCALDSSPDADYLIESMEVMLTLESIQRIKEESISLLNLKSGDTALEVGCGFANDVEIISKNIGNDGQVIAIDSSEKMLQKAKTIRKGNNVTYQYMNAATIKYPDRHFSCVHADRLLVSHQNYDEIFKELYRVTQKGGAISLTDVDASTIIITPYTEITKKILHQLLASFVNKEMGRQLVTLFDKYDMKDITVKTNLSKITEFNVLNKIFDFDKIIQTCINNKTISPQEGSAWIESMHSASKENKFHYCITFFTVCGIKN